VIVALEREVEVMSVIFTGGEITLRPDFLDIVRHTRDIGLGYFVQTHGGFLTPELLDRVPEKTYFIISWDGIRSHRRVHGGAMDTEGMVGLFRMLKQRKFPFSAQYVARRENLAELPETYQWCLENRVDFTAIDLYPTGRAMKWKDIFPTRDQLPLFEELARAKFDYESAKEDWDLDEEWNGAENPYHFTFIFRLEQIFERSFAGVFYAYVASDGRVYPDNFHGGDDHLCAGSLRENSFREIWTDSFTDALELMLWKNWPMCPTCPLSKGYCDYRLPVFSYNLHGMYNVCGATDVYKEVAAMRNDLRLGEPEVLDTDMARSWDTW
jgi:MoaA/NifB/PqqE/SkfB family radical SAM enzyme